VAWRGVAVEGYEIHMGSTIGADCARPMLQLAHGPDGAVSADGRTEGSYLHGIFHADGYRREWLRCTGATSSSVLVYEPEVERALDALADGVEAALDVDAMFESARVGLS
jgi:adenosylcobyric acid synthase